MGNFLSKHSGWLWLAAFVCALYPVNSYQLHFFTAAQVLLFAWSYVSLSRTLDRGWNLPRTAVLAFAGLFWLLVAASVFWSEIKTLSLLGLFFFSAMPLTFFIGVMTRDMNFFKNAAYALAVIFGVLSLWAIVQFFFLNAYFNGQARHPLADPSSLGSLFSLALFCALGWILSARPKREHICAIVLSILLICGILSTAARGPVFAALPGIALFAVLLWPQVKAQRRSLLIVLAGMLACYGLMQAGVQKKFDIGERVFKTVTMRMPDISNNRIQIWSATVDMIEDRPLLGTGIGTYFLYFPEYRRADDKNGATMAHNDPMQFWAELGILGPLLFYAFAFAAAFRSFGALKRAGKDKPGERIAIVSLFAGLGAMVVGSHVGFNHYNISILMLAGLMLAAWFQVTARAMGEPERRLDMPGTVPAGANRALLALPFVMAAWMTVSLMTGEYFVNRARGDLFAEKMFDFADNINNANKASQGLNFRAYLLAVNVPMSILEYNGGLMDDEQKIKLYDQVKGYMDSVIALNPRMPNSYYYLARVQGLVPPSAIAQGTPTPEEYYKKALALEPLYISARLGLLDLARARKAGIKEQIAILEPGLGFLYTVPTVEQYYGELANLYLEDKNYGKAKEVMRRMANFKKRSAYSLTRQNTSIPQAIVGGDAIFERTP